MVDLCLHWTSRSLGSTVELCRKLANQCQVSLFPCFLVYDNNDCAYAVYHLLTCACCKLWSRAALGITCPKQVMFCLLLYQAYWLKLVVLNVASVGLFYFSLCICYAVCPFPHCTCVSDWPAYHLYLEM